MSKSKSTFRKARRVLKQNRSAKTIITPFYKFMRQQTIGGILLLIFTAVAIASANIPALHGLHEFWSKDFTLTFNFSAMFLPLHTVGEWVNSALMVIFFFSVGLEIKREIMVGELSSIRNAM
ncbi:MAG: Na+/H+ antiporter NhaA, partial [Prevotellaceae bacterium]|nr:Na+/H+ antiporter NhaA [Prevotellaceae bacterium]